MLWAESLAQIASRAKRRTVQKCAISISVKRAFTEAGGQTAHPLNGGRRRGGRRRGPDLRWGVVGRGGPLAGGVLQACCHGGAWAAEAAGSGGWPSEPTVPKAQPTTVTAHMRSQLERIPRAHARGAGH